MNQSRKENALASAVALMADKMAELKPRARGWSHAIAVPVILAAGAVLVLLSPTTITRVGSAVFIASALVLFGVSAIYHRGTWEPPTWAMLRRLDHANINLLIAGSYTPFALMFLDGRPRVVLLTVIWAGALLGIGFRVFWTSAPRWLYTPIYIALGWAAVFFLPDLIDGARRFDGGIAISVAVLVILGGVLYTLGGVVYAMKRPNPWPTTFGFHEIFHTLTVLAFLAHYVAVSLATYSLR